MWARERCRISLSRFLAECRKRRLNRGSFVLLYFAVFAFLGLCLFCAFSCAVLFVSISQVIGCEDRLRNDSVRCGIKHYSNSNTLECVTWAVNGQLTVSRYEGSMEGSSVTTKETLLDENDDVWCSLRHQHIAVASQYEICLVLSSLTRWRCVLWWWHLIGQCQHCLAVSFFVAENQIATFLCPSCM